MICCAISDTHNQHELLTIPKCDLLFHSGDFTAMGSVKEIAAFNQWLGTLGMPKEHIIVCAGNHDLAFESDPGLAEGLLTNCTYLRDELYEVQGLKIYGRPWVPKFYDWAFMADRESPKMLSTLSIIPSGIDVLLTHGPAFGILDMTNRGERVGCKDLLFELERIKPRVLICGHIHHSTGVVETNGTKHINAAILNDQYVKSREPIVFEL